jgi:uncharacterized protein DUF5989
MLAAHCGNLYADSREACAAARKPREDVTMHLFEGPTSRASIAILLLLLVGGLIIFAQSRAIGPFIYTLF